MDMNTTYKLSIPQLMCFLNNANYRFAKSMPKIPHFYTLKTEWNNDKLFESVVLKIREIGFTEYFYEKPYTYVAFDGWKYWTMGNPLNITKLINRKKLTDSEIESLRIAGNYLE